MPRMWVLFWPAVTFVVRHRDRAAVPRRAAARPAPMVRWQSRRRACSWPASACRPILWCFVLGFFVAIDMVELPRAAGRAAARRPRGGHHRVGHRHRRPACSSSLAAAAERAARRFAVGVTGLFRAAVRAVILSIGLLVLLDSFGIQITPMLTALGVGGLAVALALQDTLSNLFAGVHLLADQADPGRRLRDASPTPSRATWWTWAGARRGCACWPTTS